MHDGCSIFERERERHRERECVCVRHEIIRRGLRGGKPVKINRVLFFMYAVCGQRCLSQVKINP